jgi:hypothetical protein
MARGRSRGHKGGRKQFSNPDQIKEDLAKAEEKRRWREEHPDSSSEESEDEAPTRGAAGGKKGAKDDSDVSFQSSSSSSEESESEDENAKKKGVAGVIEIENPNRVKQKMKKASQLDTVADKPQLSRREREELDKQKAKAHYQKMHAAGKTEEARADLARLAIIRKQREDAATKRADDIKAKENAAKAKNDAKTAGKR